MAASSIIDMTRRAGLVLDDDLRLAQLAELRCHETRKAVGAATRGERHHDVDGPIGLRKGRAGREKPEIQDLREHVRNITQNLIPICFFRPIQRRLFVVLPDVRTELGAGLVKKHLQ
jgi:hypothetical protein